MTDRENRVLRTRVGRADWGENQFCGYRVGADLAGKEDYWSVVALSVSGRTLSREESRVLDTISVCAIAADPRIWPLKLCRLASAYGGTLVGYCAGFLMTEGAIISYWTLGNAAAALQEMFFELGQAAEDPVAVASLVKKRVSEHKLFPGFGVPFRDPDERVVSIKKAVEWPTKLPRRYWHLANEIESTLKPLRKLPMNVVGAVAALCLDLGFTPRQIHGLAVPIMSGQIAANAYEGALQAPAELQELPLSATEYVGAGPRQSERARRVNSSK